MEKEVLTTLWKSTALQVYPCLIPAFHLQENGLYFGQDRLMTLEQEELLFLMCCDGSIDFESITDKIQHAELYRDYFSSVLVDLPDMNRNQIEKENILVISPHAYEAYISVGSAMKKWAESGNNVQHISCFSSQTGQRKEFIPERPDILEQLRRDETEICARLCQVQQHFFQFPDQAYAQLHLLDKNFTEGYKKIFDALRQRLYQSIRQIQPKRIYFPAALSKNRDGQLIHEIVLDFYKKSFFPDSRFYVYEDFPFNVNYNTIDDFKLGLRALFVDCEDVFESISNDQATVKWNCYRTFSSLFTPSDKRVLSGLALRNSLLAAVSNDHQTDHFMQLIPHHSNTRNR